MPWFVLVYVKGFRAVKPITGRQWEWNLIWDLRAILVPGIARGRWALGVL